MNQKIRRAAKVTETIIWFMPKLDLRAVHGRFRTTPVCEHLAKLDAFGSFLFSSTDQLTPGYKPTTTGYNDMPTINQGGDQRRVQTRGGYSAHAA